MRPRKAKLNNNYANADDNEYEDDMMDQVEGEGDVNEYDLMQDPLKPLPSMPMPMSGGMHGQ